MHLQPNRDKLKYISSSAPPSRGGDNGLRLILCMNPGNSDGRGGHGKLHRVDGHGIPLLLGSIGSHGWNEFIPLKAHMHTGPSES